MNLGYSSGDLPENVARNREIGRAALPSDPTYLRQQHGTQVARLDSAAAGEDIVADAAVTATPLRVASVLTADCMPLFLADREGRRVAAVHAGWRGMSAGIIESAVAAMDVEPSRLIAW